MNKYIIDNDLVFLPAEKKIYSLTSKQSVTLYNTGARCLAYLIEHRGDIASQSELIEIGWDGEENKKNVSQATYYQCFVDLRKCLKEIGYDKRLIITIRQQGLRINPGIDIQKADASADDLRVIYPTANPPGEPTALASRADQPEYKSRSTALPEPHIVPAIPSKGVSLPVGRYSFAILGGLLAISLLAFYCIYLTFQRDNIMPNDYQRINGYEKCYLFNNDNKDNGLEENFLKENGFTCTGDVDYYVSYFSAAPRISIFVCPKNGQSNCESLTYVGNIHEK